MKIWAPTQRGFAAIAAIFLVVVLAALGGFMLTFSNTQQLTSAQDVLGSRAYWAARAGLEWGIGNVAVQSSAAATCPASPTKLTVDSFIVCACCSMQSYAEGSSTPKVFQFTSVTSSTATATCSSTCSIVSPAAGNVGYIERSITVSMER